MNTTQKTTQTMSRADMVKTTSGNVSVIPATKPSGQNAQLRQRTGIRVAAYCRVSTGDESQQTSYTSQKAYYSGLIHSKPGWKFAGLYADEGISGTSIAHRDQFNQMIEDAKAGRIDYIVTKSISRFARNTLDTLTYVRELKELDPKVGIFFEKENLDTLDISGEMVLTVLAAIAQEESHSISENIRWGIRKRFEAGIPQVNLNRMLGYDKGEDGEWVINEEQAAVVRDIFDYFLYGWSANAIAQSLNHAGVSTVMGNKWTAATVLNVLRNEKYVGDIEMQKTYTKDFLTHEAGRNTGELPKFYIEDHHVAIIDRNEWNRVQEKLQRRGRGRDKNENEPEAKRGANPSVFSCLTCGVDCASCSAAGTCPKNFYRLTYSAKAVGYTDERSMEATGADPEAFTEEYSFSYPVWRHKASEGKAETTEENNDNNEKPDAFCPLGAINECALKQSFMEMLYRYKRDYEANGEDSEIWKAFYSVYDEILKEAKETNASVGELSVINQDIEVLQTGIRENRRRQAEAMRDLALDSDADLSEAVAAGEVDRDDILTDILGGLDNPEQGAQFYKVTVPEDSQAAVFAELIKDLQNRLDDLERAKAGIEAVTGSAIAQKQNFDAFLKALTELPEKNGAGMDIRVNGLDTDGSILRDVNGHAKGSKRSAYKKGRLIITPERITEAPDYLEFSEEIFKKFVESGSVRTGTRTEESVETVKADTGFKADMVVYKTNFGITLTSTGNGRSLGSFLGFKKCGVGKDGKPDGTVQFIDQLCNVDGGKVRYRRVERKKSSGAAAETEE